MEGSMIIPSEDVIEEILKHLPTKSIIRFKSVSKTWRLLIESTYFTHKRLAYRGLETPILKLLVVHHQPNSKCFLLETVSSRDQDNNGQIYPSSSSSSSSYYAFPDPINESEHGIIQVLGSCDGLVLISFYDFSYVCLLNPTTREHRTLSPALLQFPTDQSGAMPFSMRFAKDMVTGSHKVVFMYFSEFDISRRYMRLKVKVLSLDSGELRDAGIFPVYKNQIRNEKSPVFANGSLFWMTRHSRWMQQPPKLVAMDLHTEIFFRVSLPTWYTIYSPSVHMWILNDRVCLSDLLQRPNMDVWSLNQQDSNEKWEKMFSLDVLSLGLLNASFWMLDLAAIYFRRTRDRRHSPEQASIDRERTTSYLPTLISPYQGRA